MAVLIVRSAWQLLRDSTHILMENTPENVDLAALRAALMTRGARHPRRARRALLVADHRADDAQPARSARPRRATPTTVLNHAKRVLAEDFDVAHSALQIEQGDCPDEACRL